MDKESLSIGLSILATVIHIAAYTSYNLRVFRSGVKPNGATWAIWAVISLVSTGSYSLSTEELWKNLISFLNVFMCISTFVVALFAGKFKRFAWTDWIAFYIGCVSLFVWAFYKSPVYANLTIQLAILVGFVPTWVAIWKDPSGDHPKPWWLWTAAWIVATMVVVMRWKDQWIDIVYPINSVVLHASVAILCVWRSNAMRSRSNFLAELKDVQWQIRQISDERDGVNKKGEDEAIRNRFWLAGLRRQEAYLMKKLGLD